MARQYTGPDAPPGAMDQYIINVISDESGQLVAPSELTKGEIVETTADSNGLRPRLNIWVRQAS